MTRREIEELLRLNKDELKAKAKKLKVDFTSRITKEELAKFVAAAEKKLKGERPAEKGVKKKSDVKKERLKIPILMKNKKEALIKAAKKLGEIPKRKSPEKATPKPKERKTPPPDNKKILEQVERRVQKVEDVITSSPTAPPQNGTPDFKEQVETVRYSTIIKRHEEPYERRTELADEYLPFPQWSGETILYILPRDDRWIFATWEIDWKTREAALNGKTPDSIVLRIFDYGKESEPNPKPNIAQIAINENTDNWFIDTGVSNHIFEAEIGYYVSGEYKSLVRSNRAITAPASESADTRAYFVAIPPNIPLTELKEKLSRIGADIRKLALELYKLGMGKAPPAGYPGITDKQAEIAALLREVLRRMPSPSSISSYTTSLTHYSEREE
ncbi:MAG: hypothetical protein Kow0090_01650 [Myxococcota bacterium]